MRKILKDYSGSIFILAVAFIGLISFSSWQERTRLKDEENEVMRVHQRAISNFESSIHEFAATVAGMRSFVNLSTELPSQENFQRFVSNQMWDLGKKDSIIVSYLDTSHTFLYSFTPSKLDPGKLIGRSVRSIRNKNEIDRLNDLMKVDRMILFEPINLVEGWLGIPLNFSVRRQGIPLGYVAPIINFKTIIQPVYDDELSKGFAFRFESAKGFDFDRECIHDGSPILNSVQDPAYYKSLGLSKSDFVHSTIQLYGSAFSIGTAKLPVEEGTGYVKPLMYAGYLLMALVVILMNYHLTRVRDLNRQLKNANHSLERQNRVIEVQMEDLKKIGESKNRFFSILGHDLREPLSAIEGLMSLIERREFKDPKTKSMVQKMGQAMRNTKALINNLLRWSLAQSETLEFNRKRIQINDLIQETIDEVQIQADNKEIRIKLNSSGSLLYYGDAMMIATIVRNLLSNAIKFTQKLGKIGVKAWHTDDELIIEVKDNGLGIEKEELEDIFNFSEPKGRKKTIAQRDSGLGLALAMDFARKHQGTIEVSSEKGEGSRFRVVLPRMDR